MNKFKTKKILFSLVAILIVFAMGLFKEQINGDRTFHKCTMEQGGEYTYTIDVGKMGRVKYFVQPNIMTLYLRCKVTDDVKDLRCEIENIESFASQGSKKGVWKKVDSNVTLKKGPWGDFIPLNLELALSRDNIYKYDVACGKIRFYDGENPYSTLDIKIVNTKFK